MVISTLVTGGCLVTFDTKEVCAWRMAKFCFVRPTFFTALTVSHKVSLACLTFMKCIILSLRRQKLFKTFTNYVSTSITER